MIELTQIFGFLVTVLPVVKDVLLILLAILPETLAGLLLWQFLWLPVLLAVLYIPAIQYERGGKWKWMVIVTLPVAILDVYLNFTTFALYLRSWPGRKEITFSQHLERLVHDPGWRGVIARLVARFTNKFDPTPPHIPLPADPS